jgi:hypothetical protein
MKDNEQVEETTEKNDEELEETETEEEESNEEELEDEEDEEDDEEDNSEDVDELKKKLKTAQAQKEHWRKKANLKPDKSKDKSKEEINKPSKQNDEIEESMDIRFLKRDGFTDEDIDKLKIIKAGYAANGKDVSLIDATNDELFKSIVEKKKLQEKKEKAQLSPSGKPISHSNKKMSPEEFEKFRQDKSKEFLKNMGFNS